MSKCSRLWCGVSPCITLSSRSYRSTRCAAVVSILSSPNPPALLFPNYMNPLHHHGPVTLLAMRLLDRQSDDGTSPATHTLHRHEGLRHRFLPCPALLAVILPVFTHGSSPPAV